MLFARSDPVAPTSLSSGFFLPSPLLGYIHSPSSLFFQISMFPYAPGSLPTLLPLKQCLFTRLSCCFPDHPTGSCAPLPCSYLSSPYRKLCPHSPVPPFPHICSSVVVCESAHMQVVLGHSYKPGIVHSAQYTAGV